LQTYLRQTYAEPTATAMAGSGSRFILKHPEMHALALGGERTAVL